LQKNLLSHRRALFLLHLCVFIWGFTAILGNLISLRETVLVWYRMGITSLSLLLLPAFWRGIRQLGRKDILQIAGIGCIVAIHWITFYGAIKYSNVSVALTCMATVSFFTAVLEPIMGRSPFNKRDILFSLLVVPALYTAFYFSGNFVTGIVMGLCSALLAAIFTILNKRVTTKWDPFSITFVELFSGFLFIGMLLPFYLHWFPQSEVVPGSGDLLYLLILSIVCTTLPFVLSLVSLRHVTAFTANLTINLEPVYGILLAVFLFREYEQLSAGFYFGALLVLVIVFLHSWLVSRMTKKAGNM
jgi:drug/metabolite transporter (DMT)-like permease